MKILIKNTSKFIVSLFISILLFSSIQAAGPTPCPTKVPGTTVSYDTQQTCTLDQLGLNNNKVDLSGFFPNFGIEDIIGTVIAVLFGLLIAFFLIQILIAGFKWVNNDAQDKSKKEAIKKITNGLTGIVITVVLLVVVIFARGIIGQDTQLLSCASSFYGTGKSFYVNHDAVTLQYSNGSTSQSGVNFEGMTDDFRRCISLAGDDYLFKDLKSYGSIIDYLDQNCAGYINQREVLSSQGSVDIKISDKQGLDKCFTDQINKAKNEYNKP